MFSRRDFDACMALRGLSVEELAQKIGVGKDTLYRRLKENGETFTLKEVIRIIKVLECSKEEADRIFFIDTVA